MERKDAEEVPTDNAKERESEGPKRISSSLRSSNGPVSGFGRGLSRPFPGSFVHFACFVDHPSKAWRKACLNGSSSGLPFLRTMERSRKSMRTIHPFRP
jgi:hypothetical protein